MLVLGCEPNQQIILSQQAVTITVLGIRGDQVHLGIVAPSQVSVHRKELWDLTQQWHELPAARVRTAKPNQVRQHSSSSRSPVDQADPPSISLAAAVHSGEQQEDTRKDRQDRARCRFVFSRSDGESYTVGYDGPEPMAPALNLIWQGWRPVHHIHLGAGAALVHWERD